MRIEILDSAKQDFLDGFWFYEKQSEGVGRYFIDSLMADIESLLLYAGVHAKHFGYFRMLARRFPFAIYYQLEETVVRVHAVLDCRQNPAWIRNRLARESS
jgi:plasmid stabilization system protein ParE